MKTEEEEESPSRSPGGGEKSKKKKFKTHVHIGPNARAFRTGLAFCPVCDAEKILRLTEKELDAERASKDLGVVKSSSARHD